MVWSGGCFDISIAKCDLRPPRKRQRHLFSRLSLALEPDTEKLNTAPGMGLKFLRDGMDSANLVAMYSVDGQESWNFFKNDFSNHIPESV